MTTFTEVLHEGSGPFMAWLEKNKERRFDFYAGHINSSSGVACPVLSYLLDSNAGGTCLNVRYHWLEWPGNPIENPGWAMRMQEIAQTVQGGRATLTGSMLLDALRHLPEWAPNGPNVPVEVMGVR